MDTNTQTAADNDYRGKTCPMHHSGNRQRVLRPEDELLLPFNKRIIAQYSREPSFGLELHLYYGDKEISFDEPELFEFGEQLAKQSRFVANAAVEWGRDLRWPNIKKLLEQLLDEGILKYADDYAAYTGPGRDYIYPSPLPPAQTDTAHTWLECAEISKNLTGRSFEAANLEMVIPVFRIAHIALDAEGRQVGEANVFPKQLRLDVASEWRVCPYSGSRYLSEKPMNVTALRSMGMHWPQMMKSLLHIRSAYLQRFPLNGEVWTVLGLEALATLVLSVPTFQLMRANSGLKNGQLHPVLSNMFRVTDGLRMVMHQMIFVPVGEPTLPPDAPMTSTGIFEYSERNHAFTSEHGVCAGPRVMIEEFLNVLVNGVPADGDENVVFDTEVEQALKALEPAFDYGLYGLQVHAIIFSVWPVMTRTYVRLWEILENWDTGKTATVSTLHTTLQKQIDILNTQTYHANEEWRTKREFAYAAIHAHCADGLNQPKQDKSLTEQIAPVMRTEHQAVYAELGALLNAQCIAVGTESRQSVASLLSCLMDYFLQVQAILRLADKIQNNINTLLGRAAVEQAFAVADMNIHNLLQGNADQRLAFLTDVLESVLGINITITKNQIEIVEK